MTECLFVSDLHLDASRPAATAAFLRFLETDARTVRTLYILGDLFEFWIGDDATDDTARTVTAALRRYTAAGHACSVMRGNRDFLLGRRFESITGARVLPDPTCLAIAGERTLLMHGDLLCTGDAAYQRYRARVNNPLAQRLFLALPRRFRQWAGDTGRERSRRQTATKPAAIMDVDSDEVVRVMRRHDCSVLIHGHTHRPGEHLFDVDGRRCRRIVLGDWYTQGSVLHVSAAGYALRALPFG